MDVEHDSISTLRQKPKKRSKKIIIPEGLLSSPGSVIYETSMRGNRLLHYMGHKYIKNNVHGANIYWKCTKWHNGCKARAITNSTITDSCYVKNVHNHDGLNESKFSIYDQIQQ